MKLYDDDNDDSDAEIAIKKVKMIMLMMMMTVIMMTKNKKSPLTISSSLMSWKESITACNETKTGFSVARKKVKRKYIELPSSMFATSWHNN